MTSTEPLFYNPLAPGHIANPYPHFAEMRQHEPVHLTLVSQWVLFRYDDTFRPPRDPALSVSESNIEVHDPERLAAFEAAAGDGAHESTGMLGMDPPDHTRLRRLVSKAFTPSAIETLRPRVQELVDAALDPIAERGSGEIVAELAFPLPFDVISKMLGMPDSDKHQVAQLRAPGAGQHLTFGSGARRYLGASLAKLEARLAIGSFVRRFATARIIGEPLWNGRINLRGLEHLEVAIS